MTAYKMLSDDFINKHRKFMRVNMPTMFSANNHAGAHDVVSVPRRIPKRRKLAMDQARTLDPDTVSAVLDVITQAFGEDATGSVMKYLDGAYPGSCGDLTGVEDPEAEAETARQMKMRGGAGDDEMTDEEFAKAGAGDDEPDDDDWSPKGQFKRARSEQDFFNDFPDAERVGTDRPPSFKGMPRPGGKMSAQDRRLAMDAARRADRYIENSQSFEAMFPESQRIKLL